MKKSWIVFAALALLVLAGCADDSPDTYTVTYAENTSTGGSVPIDSLAYTSGQEVTVIGNTNGLVKAGHEFLGWTNSAGITFTNGQSFFVSNENVVLYAKWDSNPVANAGTNFSATLGTEVTLDGSGSSDVETTLTCSWVADAGNPAVVTFSDSTAVNPTFTAPTTLGDYTFTLTVSDGVTNSSATVTVTVGLATSVYVSPSGSDSNLGVLKGAPKQSIKSGFDYLAQGGTIYVSGDYTYTANDSSVAWTSAGLYITKKSNFSLSGGWDSAFSTQGSASVLHGNNARSHVVMFYQCTNFSMENFTLRNGYCSSDSYPAGTGMYVWHCGDVSLNLEVCYNTNMLNNGGGIYFSNTDRISLRGSVHHNHTKIGAVYAFKPTGFTNYADIHDNYGWYTGYANGASLMVQGPHGAAYISGMIYNNVSGGTIGGGVCTGNNTVIAGDAVITNNTASASYVNETGIGVYNHETDDGTSYLQSGAVYSPNIQTNQTSGGWYTLTGANNVRGFTIQ